VSRLDLVEGLVRLASVSGGEGPLADLVARELAPLGHLDVVRLGDNVIARTRDRDPYVILAAHLDTVPGDAEETRRVGDTLFGVGACDTKGSVAGLLELARTAWPVGVTYVFYAREEIAREQSGLLEIFRERPDLLQGEVAVVGEPTLGAVEAGCQGSLRARVRVAGRRAHTSRPFAGVNAIHRLAPVLVRVSEYEPRTALLDEVAYTEQLQVVRVGGGLANNVVPDEASAVLNFRFAPDRDEAEAEQWLRDFLAPALESSDDVVVEDLAPAAPPALTHSDLRDLVGVTSQPARAKVGWTDVATFANWGVASANFGAGDPLLAHSSEECLREAEMDEYVETLRLWLSRRG
jgi:succinyl-diaminopimelate desuccinylase